MPLQTPTLFYILFLKNFKGFFQKIRKIENKTNNENQEITLSSFKPKDKVKCDAFAISTGLRCQRAFPWGGDERKAKAMETQLLPLKNGFQ